MKYVTVSADAMTIVMKKAAVLVAVVVVVVDVSQLSFLFYNSVFS